MELDLGKLEFHATQYSSLPSSSSMWHFFNKKIHANTSFFETRVFKTRFTQQTRVSKKWYIATSVASSGILLIISTKSDKWQIWPSFGCKQYIMLTFFLEQKSKAQKECKHNVLLTSKRWPNLPFITIHINY